MGVRRGNEAETQGGSRLRKGDKLADQGVFPQTKGAMRVARQGRIRPRFAAEQPDFPSRLRRAGGVPRWRLFSVLRAASSNV